MAMSDDGVADCYGERKVEEPPRNKSAIATSEIPSVAPETVFELLGDHQRRAVFSYLENTEDGQASVSDIVAYVSQEMGTAKTPSQIEVQLHHVHLPKMDDAGLIEYANGGQTVQYIGHPLVEDCLCHIDGV